MYGKPYSLIGPVMGPGLGPDRDFQSSQKHQFLAVLAMHPVDLAKGQEKGGRTTKFILASFLWTTPEVLQ
jgi:hypothetical protein